MKDIQQLLRYFIPGGFVFLYVYLLSPLFRIDLTSLMPDVIDKSGLYLIMIFPIGFVSSTIHHIFYNKCKYYRIDLKKIIHDQLSESKDYNSQCAEFNVLWRKQSYKKIFPEINQRNNGNMDLMHSSGTVLVSLVVVMLGLLIFSEITHHNWFPKIGPGDVVRIVASISLLIIHLISYWQIKNNTQKYLEDAYRELTISNIK
jgi:hypothetical protein